MMKIKSTPSESVNSLRHRQKKIVAAVDFSTASLHAAEQAAWFAKAHQCELVLLYVIESGGGLADLFRDNNAVEKHRIAALERLEKLEAKIKAPGVNVSKMIVEGKPHRAIVSAADSILAQMIVMGTSGRDTGKENHVGSNLYSVVRMSDVPVVTLNLSSRPHELKRVLVPVDPNFGIRELRVVMEMYQEMHNCEIVLLSLTKPGEDPSKLNAYLSKQKDVLANHGIKHVTTKVAEAEEILNGIVNVITSDGFDMVWLETHGRSGISSLVSGSITEELLFYSPVPVLSLKPVRETAHNTYYHSTFPV